MKNKKEIEYTDEIPYEVEMAIYNGTYEYPTIKELWELELADIDFGPEALTTPIAQLLEESYESTEKEEEDEEEYTKYTELINKE